MTFVEYIALAALQKLSKHPLSIMKVIKQDSAGSAIASPDSCIIWQNSSFISVSPDTVDPAELNINPWTVLQILGGPSAGFWLIEDVMAGWVGINGGTPQNYGRVIFWDVDFAMITDQVRIARSQAETYTGQSFSGVRDFTEYRLGSGNTTLVLQRRRVRTITDITAYGVEPVLGSLQIVQVSDIDLMQAQESGILQITPEAASSNTFDAGVYTSKIFQPCRHRIEGTYGWSDVADDDGNFEIPEDVQRALINLTASLILTDELSRSGNVSQVNAEGYSITMETGRDIAAYRNIAYGLLTAYTSGEAGS